MYIKHLVIQNYRIFGKTPFEIELKPFTLILGENNVGKTNLLNAIGLVLSQEFNIFRKRILSVDDFNCHTLKQFKQNVLDKSIETKDIDFPEVLIEITLVGFEENDNQAAVVGDWISNKEFSEAKITYRFAPRANFNKMKWIEEQRLLGLSSDQIQSIDFPVQQYQYSIYGGGDITRKCDLYFLNMIKMEYLDALRDAGRELMAGGDYRLLYKILNQKADNNYSDLKDALGQIDDAISNNPNLEEIKAKVGVLLDKVSLNKSVNTNKVNFKYSSMEISEVLKRISIIYGDSPVDVSRNGLGRNNLLFLSLILSQLSSVNSAGNPVSFRLIAVEEPEAHLHPHLQDHLAKNIESIQKEPEDFKQILVTSHSTHIAAKLELENTVLLYKTIDNNISSHYILDGFGDRLSEKRTVRYLSKYLDSTKSRMFFAQKLILVEGISEQLLMPVFYQNKFNRSIEQNGIEVLNVNGVAFRNFLEVIKNGFFIKCLVLTDSDTDTKTENRASTLKEDYEDGQLISVQISSNSTFEKDLIEANRTEDGMNAILSAITVTRPNLGKAFQKICSSNGDMPVDEAFNLIEEYKSEFAFNLIHILSSENTTNLPQYISDGFDFLGSD